MYSRTRILAPSLLVLLLGLAGCRTYDVAPSGMVRGEHEFRRYLAAGRADSALLQLGSSAKKSVLPKDDLLRLLFEGVAAHYAGDFDRSATAFDRASLVAEDRSTKSISRAALSLAINDLSLAYEPSRTEQLLIPYYAALTYTRAGRMDDAAVEARRLSALLQKLEDDKRAPDRRTNAFFRYFAGTIFEAAGQGSDAAVAYRNAFALDSTSLPALAPLTSDSTGEVIVFVEHGFAPHRVQESLLVMLADWETHEFDDRENDDERRDVAAHVAERVLQFANNAGPRTGEPRTRTLWVPAAERKSSQPKATPEACDSTAAKDGCGKHEKDHSYLLRMSWPVMYEAPAPLRSVRVQVDSLEVTAAAMANVSDGVLADFRGEQAAILARTIVRAVAKYSLTRSAEKAASKKNDALGDVVGTLANITGALTEQADTRSWHLLPASISLMRVRLPAGTHHVRIDAGTDFPVETAAVTVQPGRVAVLSTRIWN